MKPQFTLKSLFLLTTLACCLVMVRTHGRYAYYELRGYVAIEVPAWGLGVFYSWPDDGFDDSYTPQLTAVANGAEWNYPESTYIEPRER